ncbi:MAG: polysaccharide biosynthesis tyrosine autokinase [Lachnospiraceae bacterium]|nr:polysaccharide biosynthesis tyrosine autokinase [Lachnospiraceae bacterium]MBQ7261926.1 polysaccharide biosynthesis tyrosine autokinase [Lachnospiraceae bacterium]
MREVNLTSLSKQSNTMTEALRELRTNIGFCGDDIRTILFTSALPNEGKSTVVVDIARSLDEAGKRVLIIDSDMRKSVLVGRLRAKAKGGETIKGLSLFLSGQCRLEEVLYKTQLNKMYMIFSGPRVLNPTELLEKKYFSTLVQAVREKFDYVLIDCAPLGAAIDAAVVARECDGAVIVAAQGTATSKMLLNVKRQLENAGVSILGAVLNKVDMKKANYYGKYYGGYYGKYYGKYYSEYYDS